MKKIFCIIMAALLLSGCGNNEEKARKLYNKAVSVQRAGNQAEAEEIYQKIVDKFPATETAVQVNEMLARMDVIRDAGNRAVREIQKQSIEQALKLYKLDNGEYPTTTQGLSALISPPDSGRAARRWRAGGYIENPEILDYVESYKFESGGSPEIVMK